MSEGSDQHPGEDMASPKVLSLEPSETLGDLHTRVHQLQDDHTSYFVRTKAGALCFRQGTEVAAPREDPARSGGGGGGGAGTGSGPGTRPEIGRASCRERVSSPV